MSEEGKKNMTNAVILHTVSDVKHCLQNQLHKDAELFSSNLSVVYYLRYKHNLICQDLSMYFEPKNYCAMFGEALQMCHSICKELDQNIGSDLNKTLNFDIHYFETLYAYTGAAQLAAWMSLKDCINSMTKEYCFEFIYVYNFNYEIGEISLEDVLMRLFPSIRFFFVHCSLKQSLNKSKTAIGGISINQLEQLLSEGGYLRLFEYSHQSRKNSLVLEEGFDEPQFYRTPGNQSNLAVFNPGKYMTNYRETQISYTLEDSCFPDIGMLTTIQKSSRDSYEFLSLFYQMVKKDFCTNIVCYMQFLHQCRLEHEQVTIHNVYWEIPMFRGLGALIIEYFMRNGSTKVIGASSWTQAFLENLDIPYSFEYMFGRCNEYISRNLAANPIFTKPKMIIPKKSEAQVQVKDRISIDVAFIPSHTYSFFQTNNLYINEGGFEFVEYLDKLNINTVHIAIRTIYNNSFCSMLSACEELQQAELLRISSLEQYLTQYAPKVLILDIYSPILDYLLAEDTIIIMINHTPFTQRSNNVQVSKKRVYVVNSFSGVIEFLKEYFSGAKIGGENTFNCFWCSPQEMEETVVRLLNE